MRRRPVSKKDLFDRFVDIVDNHRVKRCTISCLHNKRHCSFFHDRWDRRRAPWNDYDSDLNLSEGSYCATRYKTRDCNRRTCPFGTNCSFRHPGEPLLTSTRTAATPIHERRDVWLRETAEAFNRFFPDDATPLLPQLLCHSCSPPPSPPPLPPPLPPPRPNPKIHHGVHVSEYEFSALTTHPSLVGKLQLFCRSVVRLGRVATDDLLVGRGIVLHGTRAEVDGDTERVRFFMEDFGDFEHHVIFQLAKSPVDIAAVRCLVPDGILVSPEGHSKLTIGDCGVAKLRVLKPTASQTNESKDSSPWRV